MVLRICLVRSRYVVANTARWSHPNCVWSFFIRRIVPSMHLIVALRQRQTGPGCVASVVGAGGRSCGHGGFGSCEAAAGGARLASAATASTVAADPQPRVDFLPSNLS